MNTKYAKAQILKESFSFLENFGFKVSREESCNYGSYVEYKGNGIKIYLGFDYKSYAFSFDLYKNENLQYSDVAYGKDIIPFYALAKRFNLEYKCEDLQPNIEDGYEMALKNNIKLLKSLIDVIVADSKII
jgi:hypothetical protein